MRKKIISEYAAKAGIYLISSLTLFAFLFFMQSARHYSAATIPAGQAPAASLPAGLPPDDTLRGPAGQEPDTGRASAAPGENAAPPGSTELPEVQPGPFEHLGTQDQMTDAQPNPQALAQEVARLAAMGYSLPAKPLQYAGRYHATAYCCEVYPHICGGNGVTASGTVPTPGLTAAADWAMLPPGTWVYIAGVGIRRIEDSGSAIKEYRLDIAVDTHDNALRWPGFGRHDVWVLAWPRPKASA